MMYQIMQSINNFFEKTAEVGTYKIEDGKLKGIKGKYIVGQYLRIMDSIMSDGVYKITGIPSEDQLELEGLSIDINEEFTGYIVGLAVPQAFIELAKKMTEYDAKLKKHKGVASESIPNYSVSFDTSIKSANDAFSLELSVYKRPYLARYYFLNWTKNYE